MFAIRCESCAAKLKVRNPALINQVLACPKCGSMIKVVPPEDYDPSRPERPATSEPTTPRLAPIAKAPSDLDDLDFSEIERMISEQESKAKAPAALPSATAKPSLTNVSVSTVPGNPYAPKPKTATDQNPLAAPLRDSQKPLPSENWTNPQAKQRQRVMWIATISVVSILILGSAVYAAIKIFGSKSKQEVAQNDSSKNPVEKNKVTPAQDIANQAISKESDNPGDLDRQAIGDIRTTEAPPPNSENSSNQYSSNADENASKKPDPSENTSANSNSVQTPQVVTQDSIPALPNQPSSIFNLNPNGVQDPKVDPTQSSSVIASPLASNSSGISNPQLETVAPSALLDSGNYAEELDEYAQLLASQNVSETEISEMIDPNRGQNNSGFADVYVEKVPLETPISVSDAIGFDIPRLQYTQIPLLQLTAELSELVHTPIAFKWSELAFDKINPNSLVDVDAQGRAVSILGTTFETMALTAEAREWGIEIVPVDTAKVVEAIYDIPAFSGPQDRQAFEQDLILGLQKTIEPQSWGPESMTSIVIKDSKMVVNQVPRVQRKIEALLKKFQVCAALVPFDADALPPELMPRFYRADSTLAQKPLVPLSESMTLDRYAVWFTSQTGVRLLIDWEALIADGWQINTKVPRYFHKPQAAEAVRELAHAMNLSMETLDDSTLVLTSHRTAMQMRDIEVYPIEDFVSNGTKPELIVNLLQKTVGKYVQNDPDNPVLCTYYPPIKGVIIVAPQSIQRKVENVLGRLRGK